MEFLAVWYGTSSNVASEDDVVERERVDMSTRRCYKCIPLDPTQNVE